MYKGYLKNMGNFFGKKKNNFFCEGGGCKYKHCIVCTWFIVRMILISQEHSFENNSK